jgi:hypothetical protein
MAVMTIMIGLLRDASQGSDAWLAARSEEGAFDPSLQAVGEPARVTDHIGRDHALSAALVRLRHSLDDTAKETGSDRLLDRGVVCCWF